MITEPSFRSLCVWIGSSRELPPARRLSAAGSVEQPNLSIVQWIALDDGDARCRRVSCRATTSDLSSLLRATGVQAQAIVVNACSSRGSRLGGSVCFVARLRRTGWVASARSRIRKSRSSNRAAPRGGGLRASARRGCSRACDRSDHGARVAARATRRTCCNLRGRRRAGAIVRR